MIDFTLPDKNINEIIEKAQNKGVIVILNTVKLTYDIEEKRVNKVRKILKKYLSWIQNSIFEGELSEGKVPSELS